MAIQHRMAYQGEYFMDRYGKKAAERTPPVRRMLELGIPVGGWNGRYSRGQLQSVGFRCTGS